LPTTTPFAPATTVPTPKVLLAEARGWAFRVRSTSCLATGSSFELGDGIVTNRHVASGSATVQLSTWDGSDFSARVDAISGGPDLAVLSGSAPPGTTGASLAPDRPKPGTAVWAAGYPEGDQLSVLPGRVVGYIKGASIGSYGQVMEITNRVKPGNSGSALLDREGVVVGVVFARDLRNGYGLAVPVKELRGFLAAPGDRRTGECAQ
jgi:S1-C subfamily serine protease